MEAWVAEAWQQTEAEGVHGKAITPYLLAKMNELSGGESLKANLARLRNNAAVAAQIAAQIPEGLQEWRYI
jgi:pseudouridine-5'-phosphate glycosidase